MKYFSVILLAPLVNAHSRCKCIHGEPCWPSQSAFHRLTSEVSQPLLYPRPPEAACYPALNPSGNCSDVRANAFDSHWRSDQPGAMYAPIRQTYTRPDGSISGCFLNTTLGLPCEQGSVPVVGVDVRSVEDAQTAVKFAASHNLRIVIKTTG
jgi:hypothetical protein